VNRRPLLFRIPGLCCSKSSVRLRSSESREILLTVQGGRYVVLFERKAALSLFLNAGQRSSIGRCTMRRHDFVSDGFLAVTAASFVLLCSGLLAIAFT
jgi:hypothetical protein